MNIGDNIKNIIKEKSSDLNTLSKITTIDKSALKDIVKNRTQPMVSDLLKIASALSVDTAKLLYNKSFEEKKAMKTSSDERIRVKRKDNLKYESLAPFYIGKHMEPFAVEIYKTKNPDFSRHNGEEFHYVLEGKIKITVGEEVFVLEKDDSLYFDSSMPHCITSITDVSKVIAAIYNPGSMLQAVKGKKMRDLIHAAKLLDKKDLVLVSPDSSSLSAANKAIEEGIIDKAYLIGSESRIKSMCKDTLIHTNKYIFEYVEDKEDLQKYELSCSEKGVDILKRGLAQMIMKGKINTANFLKAVLNRQKGIGTGRRLSLVSIFELPNLNRLIFLTDPGINPELFPNNDIQASIDIIKNAIDVAKSLGVIKPKVALLDANEVPSNKIPSTLYEKEVSEMEWEDADVYGPLSYDLALYEDAVKKKGLKENSVAGKADILVVPHIESGNFLYKSWAMTMGAEVANIVLGAKAPLIITSRSDSDMIKFLTICSSAIYSDYISRKH